MSRVANPPASCIHTTRQQVAQAMLNNERNDLHDKNNDKKVSGFTLDGSCQAASLSLWATDLGCSGRDAACPPSLSDRPLMHGGRLISVVVVAHTLLTSYTLHK
jgi:hypothetical protein